MAAAQKLKAVGMGVITVIAAAYFLPLTFFFIPYFNWLYAKEHGFWSWVFLGEIVATLKALGWPFWVFLD